VRPDALDENATLYDLVYQLDRAKRASFYSFTYANFPPDLVPRENPARFAASIFWTNAAHVGNGSAVFSTFARMNHACAKAFNVIYHWRPNEGVLVLQALKDIREGEVSRDFRSEDLIVLIEPLQELLTSYIDSKNTREERRFASANRFVLFTC
jgi:hypothetical protein